MAHQLMYHVYAVLIRTISAPPSKLSPPLSYKQLANKHPTPSLGQLQSIVGVEISLDRVNVSKSRPETYYNAHSIDGNATVVCYSDLKKGVS